MPRKKSGPRGVPDHAGDFIARRQAVVPHEFVLDAIASLAPTTRPMFGCLAVYVEDKIVLILRERGQQPEDNGVWIATTEQHHASLKLLLPSMRTIELFGRTVSNWQLIPTDAPDFEAASLTVCRLILAADPRIGKVPKRRTPRSAVRAKVAKTRLTTKRPAKAK